MTKLGYTLSSEEFDAPTLVAQAERAEQAGFAFASISDHFHPWVDEQGESPFDWGTLGAISQRTKRIELMTGVTCPTTRIQPAIVAQAAATAASLLPGRFSLGSAPARTSMSTSSAIAGPAWSSARSASRRRSR
jgi:coenzyme F420-dependent glucose-6-phosphate dehydrogenase